MEKVKVLLYRGSGIVGQIIRWRTWGDYAHVAMMLRGKVYESVEGKGVISTMKDHHLANRMPTKVLQIELPSLVVDKIEEWCKARVGDKYDYTAIYGFLVRRDRQSKGKWFCSEYVTEAFKHAGVDLFLRTPSWKISPQLVSISPMLN